MLCKPQDFIRDAKEGGGHRKVLTTSSLVGFLDQWVIQGRSKTVDPHPNCNHLAKGLQLTWAVLHALPESFSQAMRLPLASLRETIDYAVNRIFQIEKVPRFATCFVIPFPGRNIYQYQDRAQVKSKSSASEIGQICSRCIISQVFLSQATLRATSAVIYIGVWRTR